jgi:ABC-type multidrug transport system ATPase subunit
MTNTALRFENLVKRYDKKKTVLQGLSLQIAKGEFFEVHARFLRSR